MSTSINPTSPPAPTGSASGLVRVANGEFTAQSVEANLRIAGAMIKLKDGNYSPPLVSVEDRYTGSTTDLSTLKPGG